jgi:hypothetical protein
MVKIGMRKTSSNRLLFSFFSYLVFAKSFFGTGGTGLFGVVNFEDVESHSLGDGSVPKQCVPQKHVSSLESYPERGGSYLHWPMTT